MKRILSIVFVLLSLASFGQVDTIRGNHKYVDTLQVKTVSTGDSSDKAVSSKWVKQQAYGTGSGAVNSGAATNITGIIKGNGSTISAATLNTDYLSSASRISNMTAPNADFSMNSNKITNVTNPSADQDAATKLYVDNTAANRIAKDSVRAATVSAGTLSSSFENGDALDGVTLATGNRILIKNQAAGEENGIYTVNASGAPTRATDFDASGEVAAGATAFVTSGTTNANTQWTQSTTGTITVGTTPMVFVQIGNTTIADNAITDAKLRQSAGYSIIGKSTTGTGNVADITASADQVLRRSGSGDLTFGTLVTNNIGDAQVSLAKIASIADQTILGNNAGSSGAPIALTASQARTVAGGTTVGQNIFTLTNPSATGYIRTNADNTVTQRSYANVKVDLSLDNVDNTSDATKNSATAELTNKTITKRSGTTTSSTTPTINADNVDLYTITAQTADITSMSTNFTLPTNDGDEIEIWITGTASRAITWGASFAASSIALPTTTSGTSTLRCRFIKAGSVMVIKGYY